MSILTSGVSLLKDTLKVFAMQATNKLLINFKKQNYYIQFSREKYILINLNKLGCSLKQNMTDIKAIQIR